MNTNTDSTVIIQSTSHCAPSLLSEMGIALKLLQAEEPVPVIQLLLFRLVRRFGRSCEQGIAPGLCCLALNLFLVFQSLHAIPHVIFQIKFNFPVFGMVLHVDNIAHLGIVQESYKELV